MEEKEEYNFKEVEEQIRQFWEKEKIFKFDAKARKKFILLIRRPQLFLEKCILDMLSLIHSKILL